MALDKTSKPSKSKAIPTPTKHDDESTEKQDQSIKARKSSLFESHEHSTCVTQPFSEYIKTVPAAPISPGAKAALIAIGVLIAGLLLAALLTAGRSRGRHGRRAGAIGTRPVHFADRLGSEILARTWLREEFHRG
jgi:hypothetical protein